MTLCFYDDCGSGAILNLDKVLHQSSTSTESEYPNSNEYYNFKRYLIKKCYANLCYYVAQKKPFSSVLSSQTTRLVHPFFHFLPFCDGRMNEMVMVADRGAVDLVTANKESILQTKTQSQYSQSGENNKIME